LIPIFKPLPDSGSVRAMTNSAKSGRYILGPNVQGLEAEFSDYVGARYGIGVASGTDALILSLEALGIGAGDEVIVPAWSFYATAEAVSRVGATPVFVDIDETYNIDRSLIHPNSKTKAIIQVHNYGYPARIEGFGIPVISDSAQAVCRHRGHISCYSFFPSKVLGGFGDGGMVVTNNPNVAKEIKTLRVHGQDGRWNFTRIGYNSRLDDVQAAVLRSKLKVLDWTLKRRSQIAARYTDELWNVVGTPPNNVKHSWAVYTIESDRRDRIKAALKDKGIESAVHYPVALPDLPVCADGGDYPKARKAAGRVLSLPIYPQMTDDEQSRVIEAICDVGNT